MTRKNTTGKSDPSGPEMEPCSVPDCGRPRYARGLCQTHHRHLLATGELQPIRPYRRRTPGTVKFAGLRVTAGCADKIKKYADRKGFSAGAAVADILERWMERKRSPTSRKHPGGT